MQYQIWVTFNKHCSGKRKYWIFASISICKRVTIRVRRKSQVRSYKSCVCPFHELTSFMEERGPFESYYNDEVSQRNNISLCSTCLGRPKCKRRPATVSSSFHFPSKPGANQVGPRRNSNCVVRSLRTEFLCAPEPVFGAPSKLCAISGNQRAVGPRGS
jgi:hypothetical protein